MYIDFIKCDYSDKPKNEVLKYIERDKKHLGKIIQERISKDIEEIANRWYELDDIGYISENEKFLYLLREAENLYCFAYYTGTIAIVGIACEEFCKYLMDKNKIQETDNQSSRIDILLNKSIINSTIHSSLHGIRKTRNDCMHYNTSFKNLDVSQLKKMAYTMIQRYKTCLSLLVTSIRPDVEQVKAKLLQSTNLSFNDFKYRNRNIELKEEKLDLQISPHISNILINSIYYIAEIDIASEHFKEMTLSDLKNGGIPLVVDLTLPNVNLIEELRIEEGNIIIASLISSISTIGQTEEWQLLNIHDVYREKIGLEDIGEYLDI